MHRVKEKIHFIKTHYFPEGVTLLVIFGVMGVFMSLYAGQRSSAPLPYQGRLLDTSYVPVSDGTYYMKFAIYDAASAGNCLWRTESTGGGIGCSGTSSTTSVTVARGIFSALLGNGGTNNPEITPSITNNFNSGAYYLGITSCGTSNSCDSEMTPRRQLGGVPYAYNAQYFDGNATSSFAVLGGITGGQTLTGGTATTNDLILKTTSGAGVDGADMIFQVGNNGATEAMRILNSGAVLIGGTTDYSINGSHMFQVNKGGDEGGISLNSWISTAGVGSTINLNRSRSNTVGTQSAVTSGDFIGSFIFSGSDGTAFKNSAGVQAFVDGNTGSNDMPGRLAFYTTADAESSLTERMRINSSGRVGIGTTSPQYLLEIASSTTGTADLLRLTNYVATATSSASQLLFGVNRVTGGMTNIAGIGGIITNIGAGTYQGAIIFSTASSSAMAERVRIAGGGNIGIGTTTPLVKLHIEPSARTTAYDAADYTTWADLALINPTDTLSAATGIVLAVDAGGLIAANGIGLVAIKTNATTNTHDFAIITDPDGANPAERLRITSAGKMLIGTTTAATGDPMIDIIASSATNNNAITIARSATDAAAKSSAIGLRHWTNSEEAISLIGGANDDASTNAVAVGGGFSTHNAATELRFYSATTTTSTTGTRRMTLTTNGVLTMGTTNTTYGPGIGQLLEVNTSANYGGQVFSTWSATADHGSMIHFQASRSAAVGTHSVVASDDRLGGLTFNGSDGTAFQNAASIRVYVDATPGANDMPGRLAFYTTADGASAVTERMRIDSSGNVGIGTTTPQYLLDVQKDQNSGSTIRINNQTDGTGAGSSFRVSASGSREGTLTLTPPSYTGISGYDDVLYIDSGASVTKGIFLSAAGTNADISFYAGGRSSSTDLAMIITDAGLIGIGTSTPQSALSIGTPGDGTSTYLQIDATSTAPTGSVCNASSTAGRLIVDYGNNRLYVCNSMTGRGWDYVGLTD